MARPRAAGKIVEIGWRDLALSVAEAASLLRKAGAALGAAQVAELHGRAEGWPAGLYLAALSLCEGGSLTDAVASFAGEYQLVSEYMVIQVLARIPARQRVSLTRTAVLERMCGPPCGAVLDDPGAAAALAGLARSNRLVVPLDRRGRWYCSRQLFRDLLLAELRRAEPDLIPVLQDRAAGWCLRSGLPEDALESSMGADDLDAAAGLAADRVMLARRQGRAGTVNGGCGGWTSGARSKNSRARGTVRAIFALTGRAAEAGRRAHKVTGRSFGARVPVRKRRRAR